MIDAVAGWLACPNCGSPLARAGAALRCPAGHGFDIARQGYVSLLPPGARIAGGDSPAMVAARAAFLAAGHYAGLAGALASAAVRTAGDRAGPAACWTSGRAPATTWPRCWRRCRAGPGWPWTRPSSPLRRAARAHPRIGAVDRRCLAPPAGRRRRGGAGAERVRPAQRRRARRVLRPGGTLLVVTPGPGHLAELTGPLGLLAVDPRKEERLAATLGPWFDLAGQQPVDAALALDHPAVAATAGMGPSARHVDPADLAARIALLPAVSVPVTLSVAAARSSGGGDGLGRQ